MTISTFEDLALLLTGDGEKDGSALPMDHAVRVRFRGPVSGYVEVRATTSLAEAAAANMLVVREPAPGACLDALGEIANVICGNLLPHLVADGGEYRLDGPQPVTVTNAPPGSDRAAIALEIGYAEVLLLLDDAV